MLRANNVGWIINLLPEENDVPEDAWQYKTVYYPLHINPPNGAWNTSWQQRTSFHLNQAAQYLQERLLGTSSDARILIVGETMTECLALVFTYLTIFYRSDMTAVNSIMEGLDSKWCDFITYFPNLFTYAILCPIVSAFDFV